MGDYISGGGGGQNERVIRFKPECLFNLQLVDWEIYKSSSKEYLILFLYTF